MALGCQSEENSQGTESVQETGCACVMSQGLKGEMELEQPLPGGAQQSLQDPCAGRGQPPSLPHMLTLRASPHHP